MGLDPHGACWPFFTLKELQICREKIKELFRRCPVIFIHSHFFLSWNILEQGTQIVPFAHYSCLLCLKDQDIAFHRTTTKFKKCNVDTIPILCINEKMSFQAFHCAVEGTIQHCISHSHLFSLILERLQKLTFWGQFFFHGMCYNLGLSETPYDWFQVFQPRLECVSGAVFFPGYHGITNTSVCPSSVMWFGSPDHEATWPPLWWLLHLPLLTGKQWRKERQAFQLYFCFL